jgi:O-antigen ligase
MVLRKETLPGILLINSFILALFISMISNYSLSSYILKAGSVILLYILIYFDQSNLSGGPNPIRCTLYAIPLYLKSLVPSNQLAVNSSQQSTPKSKLSAKRYTLYPILFSFFLLPFSLIYSLNPYFGFLKLLNILISVMPLVAAFYYLVTTWDADRLKVFAYSLLTLGIISTLALIIITPFDYSTPYEFSLLRWSHVIYGRFISIVFLFSLYLLYEKRINIKPVYMSLLISLFLTGTYLSGLRAALLGLLIITIPVLLWGINQKKITLTNSALILFSSILMISLISLTPAGYKSITKYTGTVTITNNDLIMDGPSNARIEAAKISWEMFKERPLFGSGLGGFNRFYKTRLPQDIKYPHNIFLEVAVEFGIVGLAGLIYLLWWIFKSAKKYSIYLVVFFGYALWLALFAKDISTNTLLALGLAFIPITQWNTDQLR